MDKDFSITGYDALERKAKMKTIITLQVSGFVASVSLLINRVHHPLWFVIAFGVHVAGDILLIKKEGLV